MWILLESAATTGLWHEGHESVSLPSSDAINLNEQAHVISPIISAKCFDFYFVEWDIEPSIIASPSSLYASICLLNFFLP